MGLRPKAVLWLWSKTVVQRRSSLAGYFEGEFPAGSEWVPLEPSCKFLRRVCTNPQLFELDLAGNLFRGQLAPHLSSIASGLTSNSSTYYFRSLALWRHWVVASAGTCKSPCLENFALIGQSTPLDYFHQKLPVVDLVSLSTSKCQELATGVCFLDLVVFWVDVPSFLEGSLLIS